MEQQLKSNVFESYAARVSKRFLSGENLGTMNDIDRIFQITCEEKLKNSYQHVLTQSKEKLKQTTLHIFQDILVIKGQVNFTRDEILVAVRYLNICHKSKKLVIILNGEIVYIPQEYMPFGEHMITSQLEDMYMRYQRRFEKEEAYTKKIKHKAQSIKNKTTSISMTVSQLKVS